MKHLVLVFSAALLLLAGCKKDETTTSNTLTGTWKDTTTISGATVYGTLTFNSNNTFGFSMVYNSVTMGRSAGRFTATGSQVSFQDTTGSSTSCYSTPCTYGYSSPASNQIILSVISDSCTNRAAANNGSHWYKQ
ncbi:MAG: hypothetical protein U0T73_07530 [Chitinophagales bacterium]